jgi:hypothetical protein
VDKYSSAGQRPHFTGSSVDCKFAPEDKTGREWAEQTEITELHGSRTETGLKLSVPSVISVCFIHSLPLDQVIGKVGQ